MWTGTAAILALAAGVDHAAEAVIGEEDHARPPREINASSAVSSATGKTSLTNLGLLSARRETVRVSEVESASSVSSQVTLLENAHKVREPRGPDLRKTQGVSQHLNHRAL